MNIPKEYVIAPVSLRVARKVEEPGRVEHYHHARKLFLRLQQIGERRMVIHELSEGGEHFGDVKADALTHYLWAGKGLTYFRRTCRFMDAEAWRTLKHSLALN